ncbi:rRNA maturation RNase YbeY [Candidatus Nomurabacteria bacterium]|nr:rRNA maturation RNase YbeY [Candidatus Nomurabacteria bacterium]
MLFEKLKNDILGKQYSLSIAYVSEKKSREINKKYRNKDKATNVLSFALREDEGELVLCKSIIKKEIKNQPKKFNQTFEELLGFLVIHGMLHLKGMRHSSTMERLEKKYDKKYFGGNRRRLIDDKSRGGRIHQGRKKS